MLLTSAAGFRTAFRDWRRSRPFWSGVWTGLAGLEILSLPLAPLTLMIHEGVAGVSGMLMGVFLVVLALTLWLAPQYRVFAGIATLVFAVASLVLSNFGGFLVGFLLGALGGAMAVSWTPDGPPAGPGPTAQPGLDWPGPGDGRPDGTPDGPSGGPGGPGDAGGGPRPGPVPQGGRVLRANHRLRALGALPAGGVLLAGLQPPATASAPVHPAPPAPPTEPSAPHGGGLTVCSLLDALLATAGPTAHVDGPGGPGHGGTPRSRAAALPGPRTHDAPHPATAPAPHRERTPDGGLLGTVTGLLGLNGRPTAENRPSGHPPRRPDRSPPHRLPRAAPGPARPAGPAPGGGTGDVPPPSLLRLGIPRLPVDHAVDDLMSLLPTRIRVGVGGRSGRSPWCLPEVSLGLAAGASGYRAGAAAARPFRVRTPLLVLTGLTYHGITTVDTRSGPQRVLAFTAYRVDIASLRQTAPLLAPGCGRTPAGFPHFSGLPGIRLPLLDMGLPGIGRVDPGAPPPWAACQGEAESDGAPGGTTTATGAPVVLLTRVLSGALLGLLPVTFTPDMPPPLPPGLTVPLPLFFTGVTAFNQYLAADGLSVPGLHQTASR